jgi:hypothetical protein
MSFPATGDFIFDANCNIAGISAVRLGAAFANGSPSRNAAYA